MIRALLCGASKLNLFVRPMVQCTFAKSKHINEDLFNPSIDVVTEEMKAAYRQIAQDIEDDNEDSILNILNGKKKVDPKVKTPQQEEEDELSAYFASMNKSLGLYLHTLPPEEQLIRSKQLRDSVLLKRDWSTQQPLNADYQDYSIYDKNLMRIKQTTQPKKDAEVRNFKNLDFLKDLDEDHVSRSETEDTYKYLYKDPEGRDRFHSQVGYRTQRDKRNQRDRSRQSELENTEEADSTLDFEERQLGFNNNSYNLINDHTVESDDEQYKPRLSLRARLEMFDLYNQGWSVRDLSLRFGSLPSRVKAVVYQWKVFFDEILPQIKLEEFQMLLQLEREYERINEVVDYGIDLDKLDTMNSGQFRTIWKNSNRSIDVGKLRPQEQTRLRNLFFKKKTRKYDIITEQFVGENTKGYYLKNWMMYKTKSKPRVSPLFERILQNTDKPYKLPPIARSRLHLGPRRASMKYGFK